MIIVAIYLYFTAWVYIHFYYGEFGLSTSTIKIDYTSYLVYSWDVLSSNAFLLITGSILAVFFLGKLIFFKRGSKVRTWCGDNEFGLSICLVVLAFPYCFCLARYAAYQNYLQDRMDTSNLKSVQFIFRKTADGLSPVDTLEAVTLPKNQLAGDMALLQEGYQGLKLLGESDDKFIVLNQFAYDTASKKIPEGYIYYVYKQDVLMAKIILRTPIK